MESISTFFESLVAVDWPGLVSAAVASGVGLTIVTQLLKSKWVKIPASRFPRVVSVGLALLVGVISTIATGIELSSITSVVVFTVVAFITSGVSYDTVKGLIYEAKDIEMDLVSPEEPKEPETAQTTPQVAKEVIAGKWGAGDERKRKLVDAGFDYEQVQSEVRRIIAKK